MASNRSTLLQKYFKLLGLGASALLLVIGLSWLRLPANASFIQVQAAEPTFSTTQTPASETNQWVQQGRQYYRDGQWQAALTVWQQAEDAYRVQGDGLNQAMVLSNIALAYQELDQLSEAQASVTASLDLLDAVAPTAGRSRILAQALNTQAGLQLAQGQAQQALNTWEQATTLYRQLEEDTGVVQSLINQAQALRALGFYRRAQVTLEDVDAQLATQPNSLMKAVGLYNLGNTLRLIGQLEDAQAALEKSLAIAEALESSPDISAAQFSLGNTARIGGHHREAFAFYERAAETATNDTDRFQAQVNQLAMSLELGELNNPRQLWSQIYDQVEQLPPSHTGLYAKMSFAQSLIKLRQQTTQGVADLPMIAQLLAQVRQQARDLGDVRAESYALGYLGNLYEQTEQWSDAQTLTEQALGLTQKLTTPADVAYRWQWQLGRILNVQGKTPGAIAAYLEAVNSLQAIRQDLAVINTDIQFSFREGVEPVYRELVSLLLQNADADADSEGLEKAREVIESLQVAELDDFFKQACLEVTPVVADAIDPKTALVYSILLENRVEVILRLPDQSLHHYTTNLDENELETTLDQLKKVLVEDPVERGRFRTDVLLPLSQKIYDWLLRSAEPYLAQSEGEIETIAFILDGPLRNVPMAILHDGEQYLVEKYSVALSPGLQLINPQPLQRGELKALAAGLSDRVSRDFPELPGVSEELEAVRDQVPDSTILLNQAFTKTDVQSALQSSYYPIVHLATHGQFSSRAEDTFIVTWPSEEASDYQINVNELQDLLQSPDLTGQEAIELLVLSACQTATGDDRAALGIAGVAFRAGARSMIATLWPVSDEATVAFMERFYQELTDTTVTKGEALRRSQEFLRQSEAFAHPFFWAPYTLIGNWL
ncbi:MAG: CHAT domain-containing protein [Leptolyngbya sp. SIOISBB]|nr:CHAT domain-containing protein [Leptolyngbya sp. SIOISBB]